MSHVWRSILWWLTGSTKRGKADTPNLQIASRETAGNDELQRLLAGPDFQALKAIPPVPITLWPGQAFMLLAQLQLALRHPANKGPGAEFARTLARKLQVHLSVNPLLTALCEKGWDPEFDLPI